VHGGVTAPGYCSVRKWLKPKIFCQTVRRALNMAIGVSKNPCFHSDFKNVYLILVKSAPKNVLARKFIFLGALLTEVKFLFLRSV
jgi:hypothetical protein